MKRRREKNRERKEKEKLRRRRRRTDYSSGQEVSGRGSLTDDSSPPTNLQSAQTQIEIDSTTLTSSPSHPVRPRPRRTPSSGSNGSNGSAISTSSSSSNPSISSLPRFLPKAVQVWYTNIRQAHVSAARKQTVERVERIREIEREREERRQQSGHNRINGWGLGNFGLRLGRQGVPGYEGETEFEMEDSRVFSRRRRRNSDEEPADSASEDEDHDDVENRAQRMPRPKEARVRDSRISEIAGGRPSSIWWWGPLNRWRLQDSTAYR